ncbi:hypothetical protein [Bacillus cereus group sp. BY6-1LC]|uniref:hypothetical protein n=1 Tax=Bacillus cereus group sp. BY6-1LC TaxID=3018077 RepID=UPI0022E4B425|nr:hypothetical protein [Bacillus cereus group sp. BY6-1LC]MDA1800404.1 hypothetical protein [Bacillus cereus group sp. BY6-1LC]
MDNKMVPVIEWISNCIELERNSNSATISLWSELYELGQIGRDFDRKLPPQPKDAAPLVVYVTGRLDEIQKRKGPFQYVKEPTNIIFLTFGETNHFSEIDAIWECPDPLLKYITICYVPPKMIKFYQEDLKKCVIFSLGKPEIWMRSLLKQKKVAGIVGWNHRIEDDWRLDWSVSYQEFSYELLLRNTSNTSSQTKRLVHSIPKLPKGLKLGLQRALKEEKIGSKERTWKQTIDQFAMQMLDEYWLLNGFPIQKFVPVLVEKVYNYHYFARNIPPQEECINQVECFFDTWLKKRRI